MTEFNRDYQPVADAIDALESREQRMQAVVDALWDAFADQGYSWIGFYLEAPENPESERLVLGPRRNKPACSPIGLHGACGRAFLTRETLIVRDVKDLGENYVACDPRDQSEIVIPMIDEAGTCWGVLDVDSFEIGAFDKGDEAGLGQVLGAARVLNRAEIRRP